LALSGGRAIKNSLRFLGSRRRPSHGFEDFQNGDRAAKEVQSAAIGGNVLMLAGSGTKEVA
jgi:hypothetical protein